MLDPNFIVLIGFILFIVLAFRFGYQKSMNALDEKIEGIKKLLQQAEQTQTDALNQLMTEKKRAENAVIEVQDLKQNTDQQLQDLRLQASQDLDNILRLKADNAKLVLDRLRTQAIQDLKQTVTDRALEMIKNLIQEKLSKEEQERLSQQSIDLLATTSTSEQNKTTKKKFLKEEEPQKQAINF
jgi:F0F1-type ATP synthase membrane subunit b/b'